MHSIVLQLVYVAVDAMIRSLMRWFHGELPLVNASAGTMRPAAHVQPHLSAAPSTRTTARKAVTPDATRLYPDYDTSRWRWASMVAVQPSYITRQHHGDTSPTSRMRGTALASSYVLHSTNSCQQGSCTTTSGPDHHLVTGRVSSMLRLGLP